MLQKTCCKTESTSFMVTSSLRWTTPTLKHYFERVSWKFYYLYSYTNFKDLTTKGKWHILNIISAHVLFI